MEVNNGKSVVLSEASVKVLGQDDFKNYLVELDAMRSGPNENHWDFQNVSKYAQTFVNTPILVAYEGNRIGGGHNHEEKRDWETGEVYWSFMDGFSERPVGYITETRTETREDGYEWLVAKGVIWRFYNRELVEKLMRTGRMSVSVETNIYEATDEGEIEVFTDWVGLGVTILGDGVAPAVPGANIHALAALQDEFKTLQVKAASKDPAPQKGAQSRNLTRKGVKKPVIENKTILAQLQEKFADYKVLAANEDGTKVCLLGKDSAAAYVYAFAETDKGEVIADRIKPVALAASFTFGEDDSVEVPVDSIVRELSARLASAEAERDALKEDKKNLESTVASMTETEKARRAQDAKTAAKQRLAEINENRAEDERIADEAIAAVLSAADNGEFADCADASAEAVARVNSLCMAEIEKIDKAKAEKTRAMSEKRWSFEGGITENKGGNDISSMFARIASK